MNLELAKELAAARDKIADLEQRNRELEAALRPDAHPLRKQFGITELQEKILAHLARGGWFTRAQIMTACGREYDSDRNVDASIKRLRRRITPVKITSGYGIGYTLESPHLETVRRIMKERI